jgi:hypothetical protein
VVGFDPIANAAAATAFKAAYGLPSDASLLGPWSGRLDNGGERIELQRPDSPQVAPSPDAGLVPYVVVERILYSDRTPWTTNADRTGFSLQRVSNSGYGNDPTNWIAAVPTPQPGGGSPSDSDGDGMPDTWEQANGLNPLNGSDAGQDADGDGMTNLQEYLAGTNPQSSSSLLKLVISLTPADAVRLRFDAAPNVSYTIQHRPGLEAGSWSTLQTVPAAPGIRTITVTNTVPNGNRFYRVTVP